MNNQRILVLSHLTEDAELGCGGPIKNYRKKVKKIIGLFSQLLKILSLIKVINLNYKKNF